MKNATLITMLLVISCDPGQAFSPDRPEEQQTYIYPAGTHVITGEVQRQHYIEPGATIALLLAYADTTHMVLSVWMDSVPIQWDSTISAIREDTTRWWVTIPDSAYGYLGAEYRVMYDEARDNRRTRWAN